VKTSGIERIFMENTKPLYKLASEFPELYNWVKTISRCNEIDDFVIADYKENRVIIRFFTKNYQYRITARLPRITNEHIIETDINGETVGESNAPIDDGYLGCVAQVRKPRAGEDWVRSRDLADGTYCEETWKRIVNDIVAFELVKIVKTKK